MFLIGSTLGGISVRYISLGFKKVNRGDFCPGLPFNDSQNLRLEIGENGENILGSHLLGLQLGNEPDLYARYTYKRLNL
jgi:hypothetical protein